MLFRSATYYLWAIDYQEYLPEIQSISFVNDDNSCETTLLQVISNIPDITYRDRNNTLRQLERDFTLNYLTAEYVAESWSDKTETYTFRAPLTQFSVAAPLQNTTFVLSGDQWATQLGITPDSVYSDMYEAVAMECHPIGLHIPQNDSP